VTCTSVIAAWNAKLQTTPTTSSPRTATLRAEGLEGCIGVFDCRRASHLNTRVWAGSSILFAPFVPPVVKQSHFLYLGLLDLVLVGGLAAVFGLRVLVRSSIALMMIAGLCAVLAGTVSAFSFGPVTLSWRHLVGVSYVTFALVWPATYAPEVVAGSASGQDLLLFVVTTVGALSLAFYGVDVARGGRHFSVSVDVERVVGW
jgi:hypothetical protein